jgi:Protein of unknown function (DUF2799)
MNSFRLVLIAAAALLAGCETMTVSECQVADWGRVGFSDGAEGNSDTRLAAHTESCAKAGVQPHVQAYRQGWDAGIKQFCTAPNGWRAGLQGQFAKANVCRGQPGYEVFSRYLEAGLEVHELQARLRHNEARLQYLQKQLEEVKHDDRKRQLRDELRHLDRDQFHLRNRLRLQQLQAP